MESDFTHMLARAKEDDRVLGFVLKGSRGKGLITERSDYDVNLVVSDGAQEAVQTEVGNKHGVDIVVYTLEEFEKYAAWGTESAWDRYDYVGAHVLIDKLEGHIGKIVLEKGTLPKEHQKTFVAYAMNVYLNATFRALKSIRDHDTFSARLSIVESIPYFLDAVFGMEGRLRPYSKYVLWDLERRPFAACPWSSAEFEKQIDNVLADEPRKESVLQLFSFVEQAGRSTGFSDVLDEWEKEILSMRSW